VPASLFPCYWTATERGCQDFLLGGCATASRAALDQVARDGCGRHAADTAPARGTGAGPGRAPPGLSPEPQLRRRRPRAPIPAARRPAPSPPIPAARRHRRRAVAVADSGALSPSRVPRSAATVPDAGAGRAPLPPLLGADTAAVPEPIPAARRPARYRRRRRAGADTAQCRHCNRCRPPRAAAAAARRRRRAPLTPIPAARRPGCCSARCGRHRARRRPRLCYRAATAPGRAVSQIISSLIPLLGLARFCRISKNQSDPSPERT
jgi:hypothetical protein